MEVVFLIGTVQAFFLSLLTLSKKDKFTGDYVLCAWMAFMGLHLLDTYFYTTGLAFKYPHLLGIGVCFPILEGPFMFVYILVMINKSGHFKPIYLIHAIPFVFFTIYLAFHYYFLSAPEKLAYYNQQNNNYNLVYKVLFTLNIYLGPVYVVWSLIKLRKHRKNIAEQFSYTKLINLNWLKYVIAGLGFVWITVLFTNISFSSHLLPGKWINRLIYLSVTATVFFLGYFGFKQKAIYVDTIEQTEKKENKVSHITEIPKERYKKSGLTDQKAKSISQDLLKYMEDKKPYLNNALNIRDVACYLNISTNHLSQVINGYLEMNFFDMVNKYRVEEIKSRLNKKENKQLTLLAIAFDCGFNSKSSFNSIFKRITGSTPSEYIRSNNL